MMWWRRQKNRFTVHTVKKKKTKTVKKNMQKLINKKVNFNHEYSIKLSSS